MVGYGIPLQMAKRKYPDCAIFFNGTNMNQYAVVHAINNGGPEEVAALLDILFDMTVWLAIVLQAVGIEVYVSHSRYPFPRPSL
jgi:hypothetical protein